MHELSYREKEHQIGRCDVKFVKPTDVIKIGDLTVRHFSTKHDTKMSFGYSVKQKGGPIFVYVTDSGMITPLMVQNMMKADVLMIEADYDEQLLDDYDGYDDWLKARIIGTRGHLSNTQTVNFLKTNGIDKFKHIIFAHLSPRTNTPETIIKMASAEFPNEKNKFLTAPLDDPIDIT